MPDGTCVGAGGGSGTINSGTTGQFSYYAGSGTTLTATSSLFLSSNQNIGIGTTTPNWLLQVAGTRPFLTLSDTGAAADNKHWFLSSQGGNFYVGTSSDALATSTISALTVLLNSNIGIGTSSPFAKFSVAGNIGADYLNITSASATSTFSGGLAIENNGLVYDWQTNNIGIGTALSSERLYVVASGVTTIRVDSGANSDARILINSGSGASTGDPYVYLAKNSVIYWYVFSDSSDSNKFKISTSLTGNMFVINDANGNVGIGTSTPTEQLSVSDRMYIGGTGTSTIENNLYVMGTLRSTVSYVGDLVFSNNFRFIESDKNYKIQSIFLNNQSGENIFKIDENGKLVTKEIESQKIITKELCLDGICISKTELKELLELKKKIYGL